MPFSVSWHTLLEHLEALPDDATLITPITHKRFRITDVQEHRVIIHFIDSGENRPLQRDQFETLYHRIQDANGEFPLDRLPPDADPYPAVLSLHPRFEVDETAGVITESAHSTTSQLIETQPEGTAIERTNPEGLTVYADTWLLIDALERYNVTNLSDLETETLVNLYTLLSDVQREANDFRQDVADVLLARLHHDRPVSGQYGSVQRTSRRTRTLKDEEEVLRRLEAEGIDRERVVSIDREKVDEALQVTTLTESDVYEITEREYVRKAAVDEDVKESSLQGLKDRLTVSEDDKAAALYEEIEELEQRISDLTSFQTGSEVKD